VDRALVQAAKEQRRADQMALLGDNDEYEDGAIIAWERTFDSNGGTVYNYVARKTGRVWYVSGRDVHGLEWLNLVTQHLQYATNVWLVTEMEQLA
jgi:hypothetical protein